MSKVLQALEEQRKSIDNLSQTLISLSKPNLANTRSQGGRDRRSPSLRGFDERGNRICFKCQGVGQIARECMNHTSQRRNEDPPHPMPHHPMLLHHTPLTKMHQRQTASLHRRESDSRRGTGRLS